jgi:hypothetical protein
LEGAKGRATGEIKIIESSSCAASERAFSCP